jgi:response regulator RpfG family c-di-GMP phosphodiesterase
MDESQPPLDTVLLIDDDPLILDALREIVAPLGCGILNASGFQAAHKMIRENANLSVVLCDQFLADGNGLNLFKELKRTHPDVIRLLITGFPEANVALAAINDGEIFRFITKPFSPEEVTVAVKEALERFRLVRENQRLQAALISGNEELQKANASLQQALSNSVTLCLDILDRFDHVLASHSSRVSKWATAIGKSFALSLKQLDSLELAAVMHDIGLISVSRSYHTQQQTGWEDVPYVQQAALQAHPKTGADLVAFLHPKGVPEIISAHHEWFNGQGYPLRLAHERIPFLASIIAVPDAYDEWPGDRAEAAKFIEDNLGTRFHPEIGRAFLRLLETGPEFAQQEKEVLISELQPDMKLACNLLSASGVVLAPKGQVLIPKLIQYIRQHDQSEPLTQRIFITTPS